MYKGEDTYYDFVDLPDCQDLDDNLQGLSFMVESAESVTDSSLLGSRGEGDLEITVRAKGFRTQKDVSVYGCDLIFYRDPEVHELFQKELDKADPLCALFLLFGYGQMTVTSFGKIEILQFEGVTKLQACDLRSLSISDYRKLAFALPDGQNEPLVKRWMEIYGNPSLSDRLFLIWLSEGLLQDRYHREDKVCAGISIVHDAPFSDFAECAIRGDLATCLWTNKVSDILRISNDVEVSRVPMSYDPSTVCLDEIVGALSTRAHFFSDVDIIQSRNRCAAILQGVLAWARYVPELECFEFSKTGPFRPIPLTTRMWVSQKMVAKIVKIICPGKETLIPWDYGPSVYLPSCLKDGGMGGFNPYGNGQTAKFQTIINDMAQLAEEYLKLQRSVMNNQTILVKKDEEIRQEREKVDRALRERDDALARILSYEMENSKLLFENKGLKEKNKFLTDHNDQLEEILQSERSVIKPTVSSTISIPTSKVQNTSEDFTSWKKMASEPTGMINPKGALLELAAKHPSFGPVQWDYKSEGLSTNNLVHICTCSWAGYAAKSESRTKKDAEQAAATAVYQEFMAGHKMSSTSMTSSVVTVPNVVQDKFSNFSFNVPKVEPPRAIPEPLPKDIRFIEESSLVLPQERQEWLINWIRLNPGKRNTEVKAAFGKVYPSEMPNVNRTLHKLQEIGRLTCMAQDSYNYWFAKQQ